MLTITKELSDLSFISATTITFGIDDDDADDALVGLNALQGFLHFAHFLAFLANRVKSSKNNFAQSISKILVFFESNSQNINEFDSFFFNKKNFAGKLEHSVSFKQYIFSHVLILMVYKIQNEERKEKSSLTQKTLHGHGTATHALLISTLRYTKRDEMHKTTVPNKAWELVYLATIITDIYFNKNAG